MLLFVALPFIGGRIGYTHAPEKVLVVEQLVVKEALIESVTNDSRDASNQEIAEEYSYDWCIRSGGVDRTLKTMHQRCVS